MSTMSAPVPRPIRLGIIGTGLAVERLHWPALRRMPERFSVVAFANHTRPKAAAFAASAGLSMDNYSADYEALLRRDDVEAVLIALPIPLNLPVTRAALAAGKAVLCEKPTGANLSEAMAFLALPEQFPDRTLMIAENYFYRDDLRLARSLLDDGAIGRLHMVSWRWAEQLVPRPDAFSGTIWRIRPGYVGGPHLDLGVHHSAQLRLLAGEISRVYGAAQEANPTTGGPSDLTLTLHFASGAVGSYTAVNSPYPLPPESNELRLYGTSGVLLVGYNQVRRWRADGTLEEWRITTEDGGYYNEWQDFYDALTHGQPPVGTVAQSVQSMLVMVRGLEAAVRGQTQTIEPVVAAAPPTVPLWRPAGASDLFAGLAVRVEHQRLG